MTRLLVATTNHGKQREFRRLLRSLAAQIVTPDDLGLALAVEEPFDTYAANAIAKADAWCRASGLLTLADDSGIEVAALGWGPGVRSARYGGPDVADRTAHLLTAVAAASDRRARMVCDLAVAAPGDPPHVTVVEGVVEGSVAKAPRGNGGFGYDPIFLLPRGVTTAELPEGEKDALSHRGRAVAAALPLLRDLLAAS